MSKVSPYLFRLSCGYQHWCPACKELHYIAVDRPLTNGAKWSFDGDLELPTFSPSISIRTPGDAEDKAPPWHCHYFLKSGKLQFLSDSTHELSGRTVLLPPLPQ
jgi:hypothetical protein